MIVLDSSALVAIIKREPEADDFSRLLHSTGRRLIGAPTVFELLMVASGLRKDGEREARELLVRAKVETVTWTARHADLALEAFLRFGKGRHPAKLNFGDCMAYALAKSLDAPLLFKGTDFAATDVKTAAP